MLRRKKPNNYGTGIPDYEVETHACVLLLEIQAFFKSKDGQWGGSYAEWEKRQGERPKNL